MKRIFLLTVLFVSGISLFACTMTYALDGVPITPGSPVTLSAGTSHTLSVRFMPDHGNCTVKPEATVFLVNDEKWKTGKDYLDLALTQAIVWKSLSSRTHETVISFQATGTGSAAIEIIRECTREGYDEKLIFTIA